MSPVENVTLSEVGKETESKDIWNYAGGQHGVEVNFPFERTWKEAISAGVVMRDRG